MPTIAVKDITIQQRENDLVLATFGRGFYVLDDYTPLRIVDDEFLKRDAVVLPVKPALRYVETSRLGGRSGRGSQGASYYVAPNPDFGAVFTYYLKDKITTRKERRKEEEKKIGKRGKDVPYPTLEDLRAEDRETTPVVNLVVRDAAGEVVRRVEASRNKGLHRVNWDLRYPSPSPTSLSRPRDLPPWVLLPAGPLALPGTYTVTLTKEVDGETTDLADPVTFEVVPLELATFAAADRAEAMAFHRKAARLQRAVRGAVRVADETQTRIKYLRKAYLDTPGADPSLLAEVHGLEQRLDEILVALRGDPTLSKHEEAAPTSISQRAGTAVDWYVTSAPTQTQRDAYRDAGDAFIQRLGELRTLIEQDLAALEAKFESAGAPWTPGRIPEWGKE